MKKKIIDNSVFSSGSWVQETERLNLRANSENYKIYINDLVLMALIGIHPHEKSKKQKISINIVLSSPDNRINVQDKIENVVSYEYIIENIKKLIKSGHIGLLETLAEKISLICLEDKRVVDAKVKIEKLEVFKETSSVGIEIFRVRESETEEKKRIYKLQK